MLSLRAFTLTALVFLYLPGALAADTIHVGHWAKIVPDASHNTFEVECILPKGDGSVTLKVVDKQVTEVFDAIAFASGKNLVLGRAVLEWITIEFKETPWEEALARVAEKLDLEYEVRGPVIRVGYPQQFLPTENREYTGEEVSLSFEAIDLWRGLRALATLTGREFLVNYNVKGGIRLKLCEVPSDQAFEVFLAEASLQGINDGDALKITIKGYDQEFG